MLLKFVLVAATFLTAGIESAATKREAFVVGLLKENPYYDEVSLTIILICCND